MNILYVQILSAIKLFQQFQQKLGFHSGITQKFSQIVQFIEWFLLLKAPCYVDKLFIFAELWKIRLVRTDTFCEKKLTFLPNPRAIFFFDIAAHSFFYFFKVFLHLLKSRSFRWVVSHHFWDNYFPFRIKFFWWHFYLVIRLRKNLNFLVKVFNMLDIIHPFSIQHLIQNKACTPNIALIIIRLIIQHLRSRIERSTSLLAHF